MVLGGIRNARWTVIAPLAMLSALLLVGFVVALVVGLPAVAHAHGAVVDFEKDAEAVQVKALFDNGEPMSGAQVAVYAPGDTSSPWVSGTTDQEGRFFFVPDASKGGSWDVEVRKAGHGDTIEVPVQQADEGTAETGEGRTPNASHDTPNTGQGGAAGEDVDAVASKEATGQGGTGFGPLQIALMGALGVWGFIGTALFFARKKTG